MGLDTLRLAPPRTEGIPPPATAIGLVVACATATPACAVKHRNSEYAVKYGALTHNILQNLNK